MLLVILIVLLVLLAAGAYPAWPYSQGWGYYPSGFTVLLIIILVLFLFGVRLH